MNIFTRTLKRQWQRVEEWETPGFLSYYEELTVARIAEHEEVLQLQKVFRGSGSLQAIAVSKDGLYLATGHTSSSHEVVIHCLKPSIHATEKLVGHPRTPLCLTFDPCVSCILYSGCLGGVVNRWNFKAGHLLGTYRVKGRRINSIVSLANLLLVAVKDALYLLLSESLEVLWSAPCHLGTLRQVKYLWEDQKMLVAIKEGKGDLYDDLDPKELQLLHCGLAKPPDLLNTKKGFITETCRIHSPQCIALSPRYTVYCRHDGVAVHTNPENGLNHFIKVLTKLVVHIAISPCENYVMVLLCGGKIIVHNLERRSSVVKMVNWTHMFNCGLWLPPSSAHGMDLYVGDNRGNLLVYQASRKCGILPKDRGR